jgi:hypothetical protein
MTIQTNSQCIDWIGLAELVVTVVALCIAIRGAMIAFQSLENQRSTNDVALALDLFNKINGYWDMVVTNPENNKYYLEQILTYFEVAAGLFNRRVLSDDASEILGHHIVEVWTKMRLSESGKHFLE